MSEEAKYPRWDGTEGRVADEWTIGNEDGISLLRLAGIPEHFRTGPTELPLLDAPIPGEEGL
jgi:hypothetical protein